MIEPPQLHCLKSPSDRPALRIGLLLNSLRAVPAYAVKVIEQIKASNFAEITFIAARRQKPTADMEASGPLFYRLYLHLDARMKPANDPLAPIDCRGLLSTVEAAELDSHEDGVETLPSELLRDFGAKNLDVLLRLGVDSVPNEMLNIARYGVWWLQPGDNESYHGIPAHFWEMRDGSPLSAMLLLAAGAQAPEGLALCKALFATEKTISVSRNRYLPFWGSADLIIQKLHELHEFGWDYLQKKAIPAFPEKKTPVIHDVPSNRDMLAWIGPIAIRKALHYPFREELVQHWRIGIRSKAKTPLYDAQSSDYSGFEWKEPPAGRAWADPFIFENQGKYWGFFEDYSYEKKRARIACAEISAEGKWGPSMSCLDHPTCHYSYPHVFRDGSEIFMVPESYDANSVDLYRCKRFPDQWEHVTVLLEGKFVDTTIWQHDGLWWLATSSADPMPGAGSLWLYFSDSLNGNWHFHPQNPISRDIRDSRGAGCVFRSKGCLIRPSQSGAPTYGHSFSFHQITELTDQSYAELTIKTVTPEHWAGIAGVHTYNCVGDLEVIDGRIPKPLHLLKA